jgi:glc operon protein GlcG
LTFLSLNELQYPMHITKNLGHLEAQKIVAVIQAELLARNKSAVIAVTDAHGELLAFVRISGAALPSILIAQNKAFTAARERRPSRDIGQASRHPTDGFDMRNFGDARYIGWGGGLPIFMDGDCVGAVGVSGLPELEDIELAELGIQALF